ncbi:MAG TPA: Gfo/Idh/MocA family oxidoreductase [Verrucomicrobiae bacterium]|jgi:predicted dehydrogenase
MKNNINRRKFLELSAIGGTALMTGYASAAVRQIPPGGKLRHACIGVTGMGAGDLDNFKSHPQLEIVAICDVDKNHLAEGAKKVPGARQYVDWRELLAKEGERIDSVNVTVPDHMHAIITLAAFRAGKHVYCQKPLAHDVAECRAMARAAKKAGVVTQLGTQFASGVGDLMAVQFLRDGVIGKAQRVVLCSNRPGAEQYRLVGPRPAQGEPPPESLAWDLWLGTAPERPFAPKIYHPTLWRSWQDFGTGWSGDIGCHIFDAPWKGLGLTAPKSVVAEVQDSWRNSPARRGDTWPQTDHITWIFPGNESSGGKDLTVEWFDGEKFPPADAQAIAKALGFDEYPAEASLVIGTEGALLLPHQSAPQLYPKEKFKSVVRPQLKGPSHYHRFVNACLGGDATNSPFEKTGPMSEAIILGTVAIRVPGTVLEWDAARARITNSAEADRLLRRTYRKGWEVALS